VLRVCGSRTSEKGVLTPLTSCPTPGGGGVPGGSLVNVVYLEKGMFSASETHWQVNRTARGWVRGPSEFCLAAAAVGMLMFWGSEHARF